MMLPSPVSRPTRARVGIGAAVVLGIVGLVIAVLVAAFSTSGGVQSVVVDPQPSARQSESPAAGTAIFVHVLGAVARPGLYQLRDGDRAVDAVATAGGFTETADQQQINLARVVSDGEQIYIPTIGELPPHGVVGSSGTAVGKVNINTADSATLQGLPRVGPTMAERIIAWREENGRFATVEDLMSVSGIGDKTFADLKELITV
jgi:competence protein ComEA